MSDRKDSVIAGLRSSEKGQLKYDYLWKEQGRTRDLLDYIDSHINCLRLRPKTLQWLHLSESADWNEGKPAPSNVSLSPVKTPAKQDLAARGCEDKIDISLAATSETELAFMKHDEQRKRSVQDANYRKQVYYASTSEEFKRQAEEQEQLGKRRLQLKAMQNRVVLEEIEEESRKSMMERQISEKERSRTQAKRKSSILKKVEMKRRQAEVQYQQREKEQAERREQLVVCRGDMRSIISRLNETLSSFEHKKYLQVSCEDRVRQMNSILSSMDNIIEESYARHIVLDYLTEVHQLLESAQMVHKSIFEDIKQARNKGLMEAKQMRSQGGLSSALSSKGR